MTEPVNLRQLAYFVAAVDAGSMTEAAKDLHVSQSAVSQAVSALERRFAVQLLLRRPSRGLTLTPAGAQLVADARALLAHADELHQAAHGLGTGLAGQLIIGCFATLAPFLLPQLVEGFQRKYPGLEVRFIEGSLNELQHLLLKGECELALFYDFEVMQGIDVEPLYETVPSVILHPEHMLAKRRAIKLRELSGEPLIIVDVGSSFAYYQRLFVEAGVEANIRYRVGSFEMARALVGRGLGTSMLIQRPATDVTYEGTRIVTRPISDQIRGLPIVLAGPTDAVPTRRARAFAAYCQANLPPAGA